jgi:hypothetical protein
MAVSAENPATRPEFFNSPGDFAVWRFGTRAPTSLSPDSLLPENYFVAGAGAGVVDGAFCVLVGGVVLVVVVLVPVVFSSEDLQPANVKASSTRTADNVRITLLMIVPLRHSYLDYVPV